MRNESPLGLVCALSSAFMLNEVCWSFAGEDAEAERVVVSETKNTIKARAMIVLTFIALMPHKCLIDQEGMNGKVQPSDVCPSFV